MRCNNLSSERRNIDSLDSLNQLVLFGYNSKNESISNLVNLEYLFLTQGSFESLEFLRNYNKLLKLEILSVNKLNNIQGLLYCKNSLKYLTIESCKNIPIQSLTEVLKLLKSLEILSLSHLVFENLDWVTNMPNLRQLCIIDCNVISGDISPAAHLEYVAIDNRKHYNYRFDSETRTIQPVIPKSTYVAKTEAKVIKSIFSLPHFGDIDLKNPNKDYETDMEWGERRVNLELHFTEESASKARLNKAKTLLNQLEKDIPIILNLFKKNHTEGGVVSEYFDHFQEETGQSYSEELWHELFLYRLAFYPDVGEDYAVYDFGFDEISPYVLSLKVDQKGNITGCEMES